MERVIEPIGDAIIHRNKTGRFKNCHMRYKENGVDTDSYISASYCEIETLEFLRKYSFNIVEVTDK